MHSTQNNLVFKSLIRDVPMFNHFVYLSKNSSSNPIGKTDEIFGPVNKFMFTVKPSEGINKLGDGQKIYIDRNFVLNLDIFTNPKKSAVKKPSGGPKKFGNNNSRGRGSFNNNSRGRGGFNSNNSSRGRGGFSNSAGRGRGGLRGN